MTRRVTMACVVMAGLLLVPANLSAQLDPKAVQFTKPEDIKFVKNAAGTQETAVLFGDPTKEGPYVIRLRWLPGNMSQPHSHPHDRFFVVISGTWYLGSGSKFEPEKTVGVKAGTYVFTRPARCTTTVRRTRSPRSWCGAWARPISRTASRGRR